MTFCTLPLSVHVISPKVAIDLQFRSEGYIPNFTCPDRCDLSLFLILERKIDKERD